MREIYVYCRTVDQKGIIVRFYNQFYTTFFIYDLLDLRYYRNGHVYLSYKNRKYDLEFF